MMTISELKTALHNGTVRVVFTKSDGTEREMFCTLKEGVVVPYEKKTERVKETTSEDILPVWDTRKLAWRSFKYSAVKSAEQIHPIEP